MGPRVVIVNKELVQDASEVRLVEDNEMVEALASNGSN
jgi:hypothetical protein